MKRLENQRLKFEGLRIDRGKGNGNGKKFLQTHTRQTTSEEVNERARMYVERRSLIEKVD